MAGNDLNHENLILSQFSKQAIPFSNIPGHSDKAVFDLIIKTSGITKNDTVLDVACGPGILSLALAEMARNVFGIDKVPDMIKRAKQLQLEKNIKNISWEIGDMYELPYRDEYFDVVITRYSFHHLLYPLKGLMEMKRVCRHGGTVTIIDVAPLPENQYGYNHVEKLRDPSTTKALTPPEFLSLAQRAGLKNITNKYYKLPRELEDQLANSFPDKDDDEKIRELIKKDLGKNNTGFSPNEKDGLIYMNYPHMIMVCQKI
ncbi:MAG: class I SAM-dependent methyltransferase [Actinobacteria bacterium]|nr:class I SAM-dependent methyltransferase [Actinomycetota bacterium]